MANAKYYYKGITLAKYCKERDISISTVKDRIEKLQKLTEYKDFTLEDLISIILKDDVLLPQSKYMYDGISLGEYCRIHNISYKRVYARIFEMKKNPKYENHTDAELVKRALSSKSSHTIHYNGIRLTEYCKQKNLDYKRIYKIVNNLSRYSKYREMSLDEIAKLVIENQSCLSSYKYTYNGLSLKDYCIESGISYQKILKEIYSIRERGVLRDFDDKELIKFIIETDDVIVKMQYDDEALMFLKDKAFSKEELVKYIYELRSDKNYRGTQIKKILKDAIKLYKYNELSKKIFNELKIGNISSSQIDEICKFLRIKSSQVKSLSKKIKLEASIGVITYFGEVKEGIKTISVEELQRIDKLLKEDIDKIEMEDLVGLYKSGLLDTRNHVLNIKEKEIRLFIDIYESEHDIYFDEFIKEDLVSDYKLYVLTTLENDFHSDNKRLNEKINNKNIILDFIEKEKEHRRHIIYVREHELPGVSGKDSFDEDVFSNDTLLILDALTKEEKEFINLKYKNNYTIEEIAEHYSQDIDSMKEQEKTILYKLTQRANLRKSAIK